MGRLSSLMRKVMGGLGILILLSFLIITISIFRDADIRVGADAYPPPATATSQPTATALPYPAPEVQPNPSAYEKFTGPECLYDTAKGLAVWLPKGWYGDTGLSVINITNYDPDRLQFQHGKALNLPADHIKIEIYPFEIDPGITVDQYTIAEKEQSTLFSNIDSSNTFSENSPFKLGDYEGVIFNITNIAGWSSQAITVRVNTVKAISFHIFPSNSPVYDDAINILSFISASNIPKCSQETYVPSSNRQDSLDIDQPQASILDFSCPVGVSYSGNEAKSSLINLQMPFPWGQTWIVGGGGSFYGNYHHCNYYNNYYATDWNLLENNDAGAIIVSVSDGVVSETTTFPNCRTSAPYGCYVDITHDYGFITRYAHLDSILISEGASIQAGTVIGTVGQTGTNNYHLHLSFWHLEFVNTQYYFLSQCFNNGQTCPNGEPSLYPQGYRPSPMWTTYGNAYLVDGLPFTSINGYPVFLPLIRK